MTLHSDGHKAGKVKVHALQLGIVLEDDQLNALVEFLRDQDQAVSDSVEPGELIERVLLWAIQQAGE